MLHRLIISNYAIIAHLEIEFCDRMNIITGETGAGKSILVGALGLILGERADTKVLYDENEKCVVEADFEIVNKELKSFFTRHELDFDAHTIVRREINQNGKSRAFINDTPVNLNVLKELGENLVNLHTQHETLDLVNAGFQLNVIDTLAKNNSQLAAYRLLFTQYNKDLKQFEELMERSKSLNAELDYLQFQVKELAEAKLETGEQLNLEAEQNILNNVGEIKLALQNSLQLLASDDLSIIDQVSQVQNHLKGVRNFNTDIQDLTNRLNSVYEELKDINREFENIQENISHDPERLEEVNARLNNIYRLQKKHNVSTVEQLLKIQTSLEKKISLAGNTSTEAEVLKLRLRKKLDELTLMAEQLHSSREKILLGFQNNVVVLLAKVGMPAASFKVDIQKLQPTQFNENGLTEIRFLFSANKGFAPQEIKEVASGGELSRLMLCIKSLIADAGAMPTLLFDEIDAGISGEVALKVGEIMKRLSRNHQLIAVTHLPQIARTADAHLYVYKETTDLRTHTRIKELKGDERVTEIAKMMTGDKINDASLVIARELIAS